MFFIKDAYARVWQIVAQEEKYAKVKISTGEKDKEGNYIYSNWFALFVGKAKEKLPTVKQGDRVTIKTGKISNISKKMDDGTWKTYFNVVIFDFEKNDDFNSNAADMSDTPPQVVQSDELPF